MRVMKDSGVEWIGEIPAGWDTIKLKYVINDVVTGTTPPGAKLEYYSEIGLPWFTPADIGDKIYIDKAQKYLSIDGQKFVKTIPQNSILMIGIGASMGKVSLVAVDCATNQQINAIICNSNIINCKFLVFCLSIMREYMYSTTKFTTLPIINQKETKTIVTPVPSLAEQAVVATYLDDKCAKIDSIITANERIIAKLKEYKASLITETVTKGLNPDVKMKDSGVEWIGEIPKEWKYGRIKYNYYLKGRIGWQGLKASEFIDTGPYLVTGTDFINGSINWETCYHISETRYNEAPEIHVKLGDLLITKDGTVGKIAYISSKPDKVSLNSHLLIMRPLNNRYLNKFLFWVIQSNVFNMFFQLSQSGSIMASLSQEKINNFSFPIPPLTEQTAIAAYLDDKCAKIDHNIRLRESLISKLTDYKKSLIYEVVTGKKEIGS